MKQKSKSIYVNGRNTLTYSMKTEFGQSQNKYLI